MKNYGYLNHYEFSGLIERLGLAPKELAKLLGIEFYNVSDWKNGRATPPAEVCDYLTALNQSVANYINGALEDYSKAPKGSDIFLIVYPDDDEGRGMLPKFFTDFPMSVHTAMIKNTYAQLQGNKANAHIVLMNVENYRDYLRVNKFHDTQEHRFEWANLHYNKNL